MLEEHLIRTEILITFIGCDMCNAHFVAGERKSLNQILRRASFAAQRKIV